MASADQRNTYRRILSLIDLTSLESTDTEKSTRDLCLKALRFGETGLPLPAAVCIFSPFIATARRELMGSGIRIATVTGGFPHGQLPVQAKLEEVSFALDQGADEIDMVFARGNLLSENSRQVSDEIALIREKTPGKTLKVILETGELRSTRLIAEAARIALQAGADFIKTSTGKIPEGASEEGVNIMLEQLRTFYLQTGLPRGIKPAGGISEPEKALAFYQLVSAHLGEEWLTKERLRFGASRLAGKLAEAILAE